MARRAAALGRKRRPGAWRASKNVSPRGRSSPNMPVSDGGTEAAASMKAKIIITPKKAVVDPQGKTVQSALAHMGYNEVAAVHVGKYLEIELTGGDPERARQQLDQACHKFLSNPIIEDYRLEIE